MNTEITGGMRVPLEMIEIGTRIRMVDSAHVASLADSIRETGLLNPITVVAAPVSDDDNAERRWVLVARAHRLEACRKLGLIEIAVTTRELSAMERIIAECDENLCGTKLTPAKRAVLTVRRKQACEKLHPETRNGALAPWPRSSGMDMNAPDEQRFQD
jgi:ParB family transcriptional regulator, chromosome partitioning protein